MSRPDGKKLPLSPARRFIRDMMELALAVPNVTAERPMRLAELVEARNQASPRPGWCAILVKAMACACQRHPQLRRAFMRWPWEHLYEHDENIASVALERRIDDEEVVLFTLIRNPEKQSLIALDQHLRHCKEADIQSVRVFQRLIKLCKLPRPLRRLLWWYAMNLSGRYRARKMGTFSVSSVASLGADLVTQRTPLTSVLTYSMLEPDGTLAVRLTFDHRVLDGGTVARFLLEMESILQGEILDEVRGLGARETAA